MRRLFLLAALAAPAGADPLAAEAFSPGMPVATYRVADVDGDGRAEFVAVAPDGAVRVFRPEGAGWSTRGAGTLSLPHPARTLLDLMHGEDGKPRLVAVGPDGAFAYAAAKDGGFTGDGAALARDARFTIRTGHPRFSDLVQDVNGDGRGDLVVPAPDAAELWLAEGDALRRAARVAVSVEVVTVDGDDARRSERLSQEITVPDLDIRDVNGDSRMDLVVDGRRSTGFHLQREDGSIPFEPDRVLELSRFRDTTPPATVRPGYVFAGTERARKHIGDLDGDGIPDYVVAHRRKIWVFFGAADGPQFTEPEVILKTADDVTGFMPADLDGDGRKDLLILRVQVPTIGTLLTSLVGSLEVEIRVSGYRNADGRSFERSPAWRAERVFRLPSLVSILRDPERLLSRIEDAARTFRPAIDGDFDGDGNTDVAMITPEGDALQVWRGEAGARADSGDVDAVIRRLLFEEERAEWDLDWVVETIRGLGAARAQRLTAGRKAGETLPLREDLRFDGLFSAEIDGEPGAEIVVAYQAADDPLRIVLDIVR